MRLGEIFAINELSVNWKKSFINVINQLDTQFKTRTTKTRRSRKAFVIDSGVPWVRKWLDLPLKEKEALRNSSHSRTLKNACSKVFNNDSKVIKFHDLRHSYAINLISNEVPIGLVAQSLGNSVKVCEKYYLGFVLADESIDTLNRIMAR